METVDASPRPKNYLIASIMVTIIGCMTLAIVAMVYSIQSKSKLDAGLIEEAHHKALWAKRWPISSASLQVLQCGSSSDFLPL